ncbi:MAG: hypothetical protein KG075_17640 [Alphaproteobacteria bacterium]|nr:hypothetical protein [Alphaproteobacteria bacterium]
MPPAVAAVGAAAFAASAAYGAGIVIFGTTIIAAGATAAIVAGGLTLAVGFATSSMGSKPKTPQFNVPERQLSDRLQSIRQPVSTGRLHYGRLRIGGSQTFAEKTDNNGTTHILYTLGVGPYAGLDEVWFNDEQVAIGSYSSGNGYAISGKFSGKAKIWFGDGTSAGDADLHAALTTGVGSDMWGSTDKQTGWAKLYVQIIWDNDTYPGGIPNVTAVVRAMTGIVDPRVSGSPTYAPWTDNAALCTANYLTTPKNWGGFGAAWSEINEAELIAAANACDEMAARIPASVDCAATAADNIITLSDKSAAMRTGTRFQIEDSSSPGGTLPSGLSEATNYYWIAVGSLTGKAATSLANARAGTAIDLTTDSTGTLVLTANAEPRYTCNGTIDSVDDPESIFGRQLSAMAGRLLRNQGEWKIRAGVWQGADGALGQNDLIEGFKVNWFREPRDVFNGVKGTFMDPDSSWQPTDFPAISVATYLDADQGQRVWKDADLPFTVSPSMAQRIARIELERNRRQISTAWVTKLTALNIAAGDIVALDWDRYGWAEKYFECNSYKPMLRNGEDGTPYLCLSLGFAEMDENVYAWTPADDEAGFSPSSRSNLQSADTVANPTGLVLQSGTAQLFTRLDGTIFSRIRASWTAPADALVTRGGKIFGQIRGPLGESPTPAWRQAFEVDGAETEAFILDVQDGQEYEIRIRSQNYLLAKAKDDDGEDLWISASHTVVGKTAAPSNVSGFSAQQNGTRLTFRWNQVPDLDLAGYEIRYMAAPFIWENATVVTSVTRGTLVTNEFVPPGNWVLGIKARDTSENYSTSAATFALAVSNSNDIIYDTEEAPRWPGTFDGFLRHDVSGALVPESTVLASAMSDAELWDEFNAYPVTEACYTAKQIDVLFDASGLRVWADMAAELGAGETTGVADPQLEIDYRAAAGAYDGLEPWTIGIVPQPSRFVKQRACIYSATGKAVLSGFKPVVDVEERTKAVSQDIAAGGSFITFSPPFHSVPRPSLTAEAEGSPPEGRYVGWTGLSATGGTFHVFNPAGSSVGGIISGDIVGA